MNGLVSFSKDDKFYINAYNNRGDVVKTIDSAGKISGTIKYSDYGAVVSQTGVTSVFKYAGQHGAITDNNGLVYLKTRYYNPALMRFMNRDTVAGSITDSQSLNRFSYVEGNPLTYVDLNGQARTWLSNNYDLVHTTFLFASVIPIPYFAQVFSALNLVLDMATGHPENAVADALGILLPYGFSALMNSSARLSLPVVERGMTSAFNPALALSVSRGVEIGTAQGIGKLGFNGWRAYNVSRGVNEEFSSANYDGKTDVDYGSQYIGGSKSLSKMTDLSYSLGLIQKIVYYTKKLNLEPIEFDVTTDILISENILGQPRFICQKFSETYQWEITNFDLDTNNMKYAKAYCLLRDNPIVFILLFLLDDYMIIFDNNTYTVMDSDDKIIAQIENLI